MDKETEVLKVEVACLGLWSYSDRLDPECSPHRGPTENGMRKQQEQALAGERKQPSCQSEFPEWEAKPGRATEAKGQSRKGSQSGWAGSVEGC